MRKFAWLGVIFSVLIILGLFLPQWHIAIGSPDVETIRPTNYHDAAERTTNPTQAYDGNTTTSGDTNFASTDDPSINYGQDGNNTDAWETKSNSWDSATLYATIEREVATNDQAGVYIINSAGTEKHTLLEMGSSAFSKQEVSQTLNSADWGGSGFPDIYDLRVKVKATKSAGPDNKLLKIYDIRIEGNYTPAANQPPTVGTITISPSPMTPQYEWTNITIPVTDNDTLADVNKVHVEVFYDSAGNNASAPGTANVQTCAILTWIRGGSPVWDIDQGTGTTWAINAGGCSAGSDALTTDDWIFSFKVGKVATHSSPGTDDWDIYANATDSINQTGDNYLRDVQMNWYGEINLATTTIGFGTVTPGSDFNATGNNVTDINATYIANGDYDEKVAASSPWTGPPNATLNVTEGTLDANEFALKANDSNALATAVLVTISPTYNTTANTGTQTTESGDNVNTNTQWIKLAATFTEATYNGTIYYQIADGS